MRIAEGLFVCSPELVFVQMASCLSFGELLALGYELCGCYPRSTQKSVPLVRRPLTTPNRLMAYAARLNGAKGAPGCSYRLGCARFLLAQGAFRH